jgi:hypothetical protein
MPPKQSHVSSSIEHRLFAYAKKSRNPSHKHLEALAEEKNLRGYCARFQGGSLDRDVSATHRGYAQRHTGVLVFRTPRVAAKEWGCATPFFSRDASA